MISRRRFLATCAAGAAGIVRTARAQRRIMVNVRAAGATGDGKTSDLEPVRNAVAAAARSGGGATVFFPPGEYFLGTPSDDLLVGLTRLRDIALIGENATLACRSARGSSSMLYVAGCRNVTIEGLRFRDYGLNRDINWLGASAIRIANDGDAACEDLRIRHCTFESVLSAIVCRSFDGRAGCRGIALSDLAARHAYYGFSFQDAGDDVVARGLRCEDVKRSYFPYGVSNHDVELDTGSNATGFTDVLVKCYRKDTSGLRIAVRCRGKRSGDAIIALDHQHEFGSGTMRDIRVDVDVDDADCRLDTVFLIRSFDPRARVERETGNRWDNIALDGQVRVCDRTKVLDIVSVSRAPGRITIGPRLARHPRLPKNLPGFVIAERSR